MKIKKRSGFTLIELVLVLCILSLIAITLIRAQIHGKGARRVAESFVNQSPITNVKGVLIQDNTCYIEWETSNMHHMAVFPGMWKRDGYMLYVNHFTIVSNNIDNGQIAVIFTNKTFAAVICVGGETQVAENKYETQ